MPNPNGRFLQATTSTAANAGTTVEAGLPNVSGVIYDNAAGNAPPLVNATGTYTTGAFGLERYIGKSHGAGYGANVGYYTITFDASRSNVIYGNSTTVQPPAYRVRYYIKALD